MSSETRAWLGRLVLSLALALAAGALVYLVVRGGLGIWLFFQQQAMLREALGALQGGLDAPPDADLRALRLAVEAQAERNEQISLLAGFAAAGIGAIASYVWLERWPGAPRTGGRNDSST